VTIELNVTGNGRFEGDKSNVIAYSYSEQSTPHMIGDDSGGVGDISVSVMDFRNDGIILYKDSITLSDSFYGSITGRIDSLTSTNGLLDITGRSRLSFLNIPGIVAPGETTIRGLFTSIFNAANLTTDIAFGRPISNDPIITPGWSGDLWVFAKQACATYGVEISLINNTIYVQPIRQRELGIENISTESYNLTDVSLAQSFDVAYYNYTEETGALVYPRGGWTPEATVYQVEAGETIIIDVPVNGYITSILQPVAQDFVPKNYSGGNSVYSVSGNDNLPVSAALWRNYGGSMTAELINNGATIQLTVKGPGFSPLSPYSFSVSDGSTSYSTIRLIGDGVFYDRKLLNIKTGLSPDIAPQEVGQEVDNFFVDTLEQALDVGVKTRPLYALPRHTIDLSGSSFVKKNFTEYDYLTLDDAGLGLLDGPGILGTINPNTNIVLYQSFEEYGNSLPPVYLFSDFNNDFVDATFDDFANTTTEASSQSFGSVSGSRVRYYDAIFRVRGTDTSQSGINVTAEFDTLFSDFNETFDGYTFEGFDAVVPGINFIDWSLIPLRTEPYISFNYLALDSGELDINALGF